MNMVLWKEEVGGIVLAMGNIGVVILLEISYSVRQLKV